jgi:hypothetical protein
MSDVQPECVHVLKEKGRVFEATLGVLPEGLRGLKGLAPRRV